MSLDKIKQAQAILGEHCEHYVIIGILPEHRDELQIVTDNSTVAMGMLYCASLQNKQLLDLDNNVEIEWVEEDDNDEQSDSNEL